MIAGALTEEQKAEKFDELMTEYRRMLAYRNNLAGTIINNLETSVQKTLSAQGYILSEVIKKLEIHSMKNIQSEIARVDTIISFISSIINDGTILESYTSNINIILTEQL